MRILNILPLVLTAALAGDARAQVFRDFESVPGDRAIGASAGNQTRPSVAAGGGRFLAVWEDDASSLVDSVFGQQAFGSNAFGNTDIHGMLYDAAGQRLLDAPILIAAGPFDQLRPRVAWNGQAFLVVYESDVAYSTFSSKAIFGVRVSSAGDVLDPTPFAIFDTPAREEEDGAVASLGGDWFVAWRSYDPTTGNPRIEGRTVVGPSSMGPRLTLVGAAQGTATDLEVAASGDRFAIVYPLSALSPGVRARLFDATGSPASPILTLEQGQGQRIAIAGGASGFLATWTFGSTGLEATTIDLAGNVGTPGGVTLIPPPTSTSNEVAAAWDGSEYRVAHTASPDVVVARLDAGGAVLGPIEVVTTGPRGVDGVAAAGSGGRTLVLWGDRRTTPDSFGVDPEDIWMASLDPSGAISAEECASVSPPSQFGSRLAGDPDRGYLLVFNSWEAGVTRVKAMPYDRHARPLANEPFLVAEAPNRVLQSPRVAYDGERFLVAWVRRQSIFTSGPPPIVEFRRCLLNGTFLDAAPVVAVEGNRPGVDAVEGTFLIASTYQHPLFQQNAVIQARRVQGGTGALLEAAPFVLDSGSGTVEVVGLLDRWVVGYGGVNLVEVAPSGAVGAPVYAAGTIDSGNFALRLARNPSRTQFLLTYEAQESGGTVVTSQIRMKRFDSVGASPDPFVGPLVDNAPNAQIRPAGAYVGDEYLFVWADHRAQTGTEPGIGDVYAGRNDLHALPIASGGIPLLASDEPEGSAEVISTGGGTAMIAASVIRRSGPGEGMHRVAVATYAAPAVGALGCGQTVPNSTGRVGRLDAFGSTSAAETELRLFAYDTPSGALGLFLVAPQPATVVQPSGSQGTLCLGGPIGRYVGPGQPQIADVSGSFELRISPAGTPTPTGNVSVAVGETWWYQAWHRDAVAGAATSNFTNSVSVLFR